jgi:hypothetical protein
MRKRLVASLLGLIAFHMSPARAQSVSFSEMRPAEVCADTARRLAAIPGDHLARKLRQLDSRWFHDSRTDEAIEATFLSQNRCMTYAFERAKCPQLQAMVNDTVGDTLGARLKLIWPTQTKDMRDQYAEMFVRTFCPDLKGPREKPAAIATDEPIFLLVDLPTTTTTYGFVSPTIVGLADARKELIAKLFKSRRKPAIAVAWNKAVADVVVSVLDRQTSGDYRTVRAQVLVRGKTFDFEASVDDGNFETAADSLATQIVEWIAENQGRIIQGRPE